MAEQATKSVFHAAEEQEACAWTPCKPPTELRQDAQTQQTLNFIVTKLRSGVRKPSGSASAPAMNASERSGQEGLPFKAVKSRSGRRASGPKRDVARARVTDVRQSSVNKKGQRALLGAKTKSARRWTTFEDAVLEQSVASAVAAGCKQLPWNKLAEDLAGRSGRQCRERWFAQLNPTINKSTFSEKEDKEIVSLYRAHGPRWAELARLLSSNRTFHQIRNRFNVLLTQGSTRMRTNHKQTASTASTAEAALSLNIVENVVSEWCESVDLSEQTGALFSECNLLSDDAAQLFDALDVTTTQGKKKVAAEGAVRVARKPPAKRMKKQIKLTTTETLAPTTRDKGTSAGAALMVNGWYRFRICGGAVQCANPYSELNRVLAQRWEGPTCNGTQASSATF